MPEDRLSIFHIKRDATNYPHNPKVAGSNPAPATIDDEGLADVGAANPFRLPRNHPGIGLSAWFQHTSRPRGHRLRLVVGGSPWPWRAGGSTREKTGPDTVWRCWRLAPSTTLSLLGTTWCIRTGRPASRGRGARCHRFWRVNGVRRLTVSSTPPLGSAPRPLVWRHSASRSRAPISP